MCIFCLQTDSVGVDFASEWGGRRTMGEQRGGGGGWRRGRGVVRVQQTAETQLRRGTGGGVHFNRHRRNWTCLPRRHGKYCTLKGERFLVLKVDFIFKIY